MYLKLYSNALSFRITYKITFPSVSHEWNSSKVCLCVWVCRNKGTSSMQADFMSMSTGVGAYILSLSYSAVFDLHKNKAAEWIFSVFLLILVVCLLSLNSTTFPCSQRKRGGSLWKSSVAWSGSEDISESLSEVCRSKWSPCHSSSHNVNSSNDTTNAVKED